VYRFLLLGHVNDTATAFANLLKQFVPANLVAGFFRYRDVNTPGLAAIGPRGLSGRLPHETSYLAGGAKQFFHAFTQYGIRAARVVEKASAFGGILPLQRRVKEVLQ
jgi:hypothetical protein